MLLTLFYSLVLGVHLDQVDLGLCASLGAGGEEEVAAPAGGEEEGGEDGEEEEEGWHGDYPHGLLLVHHLSN